MNENRDLQSKEPPQVSHSTSTRPWHPDPECWGGCQLLTTLSWRPETGRVAAGCLEPLCPGVRFVTEVQNVNACVVQSVTGRKGTTAYSLHPRCFSPVWSQGPLVGVEAAGECWGAPGHAWAHICLSLLVT